MEIRRTWGVEVKRFAGYGVLEAEYGCMQSLSRKRGNRRAGSIIKAREFAGSTSCI